MERQTLSQDAQLIYDLICTVGTVTTPQVAKILKNTRSDAEKIVKFLCMKRYTKWLNETYSVPFYRPNVNQGAINCLWVVLDLISSKEGDVNLEALQQIIEGNGVVNFSYIQSSDKVINMVYVSESESSKINATIQRFYDFTGLPKGKEKEAGVVYMYITTSKEMAMKIQDANITFPHLVAYLEGDTVSGPKITYLQNA